MLPPPLPPPPELMEELVEQILLRFPPDDPASLVFAALVSKLWCRLVYGATFHRRFREFHRSAAPMLGLLYGDSCDIRHDMSHIKPVRILRGSTAYAYFLPTTSFLRVHAPARRYYSWHDINARYGWRAIDARHDRIMLCRNSHSTYGHGDLCVWDPITNEQRHLAKPPFHLYTWTAAVACAAIASGNCDHLDCRRGPFLVIVMDLRYPNMYLSVYSSESGAWSEVTLYQGPTTTDVHSMFKNAPAVLVQNALYFLVHFNQEIVKYDFTTRQVSTIHLPSKFRGLKRSIVLMPDDDGELGFVSTVKYKLELWSRVVAGPDGDEDFVLRRVIDLRKVFPSAAHIKNVKTPRVNGFAQGGASRVLFIKTFSGLSSIEINSSQVKKVANCCRSNDVVPYISFWTPTSTVQH